MSNDFDALAVLVAELRALGVQAFEGCVPASRTWQEKPVKLVLGAAPVAPAQQKEPPPEKKLTAEERDDELDRRLASHTRLHGARAGMRP